MTRNERPPSSILTPEQAAEYLGVSTSTLKRLRTRGGGPVYFTTSDHHRSPVRYRVADLDSWVSSRLQAHTGAVPGSAGETPRRPPSSGKVD